MTEIEAGSRTGSTALPDLVVRPSNLTGRRALFAALVIITMAAVMWLSTVALSADGLGLLDIVLLALFLITLPWTVIGFWNAAIGFLILRFARNPVATVTPAAARIRRDEPITGSVALMACIRVACATGGGARAASLPGGRWARVPAPRAFAPIFEPGARPALWSDPAGSRGWQAAGAPPGGHISARPPTPFSAYCLSPPLP